MRAAFASAAKPDDPLSALTVGELAAEKPPDGWATIDVRASSLNHHEIWSLRGVGLPADRLPMILGCDAAGVDAEGNEAVVYPVVPDETDPRGLSLLSARYPGTLAARVSVRPQGTLADALSVPKQNLIPKPAGLSFLDAACLPTAWLTAYHMLTG